MGKPITTKLTLTLAALAAFYLINLGVELDPGHQRASDFWAQVDANKTLDARLCAGGCP
jgi:hypothetical protein